MGTHRAYQTFSAFEGISVCMLLNCALEACCGLAIAIEEAFARTRRSSDCATPPEDAAGHACDQLRKFAKIGLSLLLKFCMRVASSSQIALPWGSRFTASNESEVVKVETCTHQCKY